MAADRANNHETEKLAKDEAETNLDKHSNDVKDEAVKKKEEAEERDPDASGCCAGCRRNLAAIGDECRKTRDQVMDIDIRGWCREACSKENLKNKAPITKWLPNYSLSWLQGDIIAGLTVALTVIPQGIAYAVIAELPPQYGLYSAFIGCFVYCIFGTSKDISLGPTAIMSFLTAIFAAYVPTKKIPAEEKDTVEKDIEETINPLICVVLTLFCGLVQLAMGLLNTGIVVEYIAHPVINSFTAAAAITIACSQVKKWLGLKNIPREFIHQAIETIKHIPQTNLWDFGMGLICMILLISMKKLKQKFKPTSTSTAMVVFAKIIFLLGTARNALVVILATGVAATMYHHGHNETFTLTGDIKPGLPPFRPPALSFSENVTYIGTVSMSAGEILSYIGSGLIIVPILSLVETIAIGKAFARKNKYNIYPNQELIAIGISNILGSFVSAYPVTGSFSRTAVNSQSGVRTPAGGIWTGLAVLLALAFLTKLFYYIPNAALAAVIIVAVLDMADFTLLPKIWRTHKPDLVPWLVTFVLSFILGIEYGILVGVGINLLMLLYPWARPKISLEDEVEDPMGHVQNIANGKIVVVRLNMGLRFAGMEYLREKLVELGDLHGEHPKHAVLNCERVSSVDYSTIHGFHEILEEFGVANTTLALCNVDNFFHKKLLAEGIHLLIYDNVYDAVNALIKTDEDLVINVVPDRRASTSSNAAPAPPPAAAINSIPDETTPLRMDSNRQSSDA